LEKYFIGIYSDGFSKINCENVLNSKNYKNSPKINLLKMKIPNTIYQISGYLKTRFILVWSYVLKYQQKII